MSFLRQTTSSALRTTRFAYRLARPIRAHYSSQLPNSQLVDPFPLPLESDDLVNQDSIPQDLLPPPIPRPNESLDALRARLNYQSRKRGTLESDLLLSTFAKEHLPTMSRNELEQFDKLMDEPDWDIYYWSVGKRAPPERWADSTLLEQLRVHTRNEGKVVRRMPALPDLDRTDN